MALTPEQIGRISRPYGESSIQGFDHILAFAQAIEAEVRNFVAAIKLDRHDWEDWPEDSRKAFEALRARLEGKP